MRHKEDHCQKHLRIWMEITQEKYMLNLMVIHKEKAIQCCDREGVGVEGDT